MATSTIKQVEVLVLELDSYEIIWLRTILQNLKPSENERNREVRESILKALIRPT